MSGCLPPVILALSSGDLALGDGFVACQANLLGRARDAYHGGLRGILLREQELPDAAFLEVAVSLRAIFEDGWLGLHDRPHLVHEVGAEAVHLGFRSLNPLEARQCVGPDVAIGLSTHAGDQPKDFAGADYLFHGPVFPPLSKPDYLTPVGLSGLQAFVEMAEVPVWGLGGITAEGVSTVMGAGARGVATLGGLLPQDDPAHAYAVLAEKVAP